jgi:TetR/AcrR family transcriptional regulator
MARRAAPPPPPPPGPGPTPDVAAPDAAAPDVGARDVGATATRERILRAAVAEFGAHGYSCARTAAIAARAGVNAQLISYHFGGKSGLLNELRRRWADRQAGLVPPGAAFGESFAAYLDATLDQPDWSRLVIWQALGDTERPEPDPPSHSDPPSHPGPSPQPDPVAAARLGPTPGVETAPESGSETAPESGSEAAPGSGSGDAVARMRARQERGEVAADLDPAFVLLIMHALAFAPIAMPRLVASLFPDDPRLTRYRAGCIDQVTRLVSPDRHPTAPVRCGEQRGENR